MLDVQNIKHKKTIKYYRDKVLYGKKIAKENLFKYRQDLLCQTVAKHFSDFLSFKLNLGCGNDYKKDWINIDFNKDYQNLDLLYDLRQTLPFKDESVDFIFCEHFLEHLTPQDGVSFLSECRRCLKDKGVLRVAMPHIKPVLDRYYNDRWFEEPWLKEFGIKTKAEVVNIGFRAWGHQWLYDEEELSRRLEEAGFVLKYQVKPKESVYPELQNLETRAGSDLIFEAVK